MKFLTDENIARSVVHILRNEGFDVKDIKEANMQGTSDKFILELTEKEDRIIVTHDKDFGNIFSNNPQHKGIILLRLKDQRPDRVKGILIQTLKSSIKDKIKNNIIVISEYNVTVHRRG